MLFPSLTAREHIRLYSAIKNAASNQEVRVVCAYLDSVKLGAVIDKRVSTYSGGYLFDTVLLAIPCPLSMRRRLSVVLSLIGDPQVVFMDEPTTGMDPVSRRHVWGFIEKMKIGRAIVLTTHSMEEADFLGDRIAIMAHGIQAHPDNPHDPIIFGS